MSKKEIEVKGILEIMPKGHGFLRQKALGFVFNGDDPYISREIITANKLREGLEITATTNGIQGNSLKVENILMINGHQPGEYMDLMPYETLTVIDPNEWLKLETDGGPMTTRVIDLLTPIGKGQRGLIVAPPRSGKTVLMQHMANGIVKNHPDDYLMMLLVDERPEEVTDIKRSIEADVIASSNDKNVKSHVRTAKLAMEMGKRKMEFGQDVIIFLDSITRLGRAFNSWIRSSGRTMSGGLDIQALQLPKQLFGSARNIEGGGSLTIIATALVDTGSRMDEVIFQEFKGTGNMELVLDRRLANRRIYPSLNISESGTRKEELLIPPQDLQKIYRLRRHLDGMPFGHDMEMLLKALGQHKTNKQFLAALP